MDAHEHGITLTPAERLEVFGEDDPAQYAEETQQRWGDTDAYRESRRRTQSYTKQDWLQIKAESEDVEAALAAALADGEPADSDRATSAAQAHRLHLDRWFYPVSYAMHVGLAEMYVVDPRFAAHYEQRAAGLAQYVHDAIKANAARHTGSAG